LPAQCEILNFSYARCVENQELMTLCDQIPSTAPHFSVVIAVYNDWIPLEECLNSLKEQKSPACFEVIVVDDGSSQRAPESLRSESFPFSLAIIRQEHCGIPSARNLGIRNSRGDVLLFVDADCRLDKNCLAVLNLVVARAPQHDSFQLLLTGDRSTLVGRAEELRLSTFQNLMLQPDGRIRYLNTAGFALRKKRTEGEVFHPGALRGEDTLLLANLMQTGELPLFVSDAVIIHSIPLSLRECLRKDLRTVYLEGPAFDMVASTGVKLRLTHRERIRLLAFMWKAAKRSSLGYSAWFVVLIRQAFQRAASFGYRYLRVGTGTVARQILN
jgi:glycosyltransferase involved in cell wall biosynthesis